MICSHNNLEMINDEQQQSRQLYPNWALTVPVSANKGKKVIFYAALGCSACTL